MRPLIRRLLSVPHLRARYLAHLRTIVDESLDWTALEPIVASYRAVLDAEIPADTRKLSTNRAYAASLTGEVREGPHMVPGLKDFVEGRRKFLLAHQELTKPRPQILSVSRGWPAEDPGRAVCPSPHDKVLVTAIIGADVAAEKVVLYYNAEPRGPFTSVPMRTRGAGGDDQAPGTRYEAAIPPFPAGTHVSYYVEARGAEATAFFPARAELDCRSYRVGARPRDGFPVTINEVASAAPANGGDWIELYNASGAPVDISGFYLSDDPDRPRAWRLPDGIAIPAGGFLVVRAGAAPTVPGVLHASFGISRNGEVLTLVGRDDRGNDELDRVLVGSASPATSLGRSPDGSGPLRPLTPTPGAKNELPKPTSP